MYNMPQFIRLGNGQGISLIWTIVCRVCNINDVLETCSTSVLKYLSVYCHSFIIFILMITRTVSNLNLVSGHSLTELSPS
jgi:hypothetical protein